MEYFKQEEFEQAKKQKKKTLMIYFIILGIFVACTVGLLVWYLFLEYKSPTIAIVKIVQHVLSAIFIVFSFIYLGIKYKRVKRYYKIINYVATGMKEYSEASFFEYSYNIQDKDGVDFKALIFLEWNKYKKDYYERKVLVFYEKPFPEFNEGDYVKFVTQSNILVSYEIVEKAPPKDSVEETTNEQIQTEEKKESKENLDEQK